MGYPYTPRLIMPSLVGTFLETAQYMTGNFPCKPMKKMDRDTAESHLNDLNQQYIDMLRRVGIIPIFITAPVF